MEQMKRLVNKKAINVNAMLIRVICSPPSEGYIGNKLDMFT